MTTNEHPTSISLRYRIWLHPGRATKDTKQEPARLGIRRCRELREWGVSTETEDGIREAGVKEGQIK